MTLPFQGISVLHLLSYAEISRKAPSVPGGAHSACPMRSEASLGIKRRFRYDGLSEKAHVVLPADDKSGTTAPGENPRLKQTTLPGWRQIPPLHLDSRAQQRGNLPSSLTAKRYILLSQTVSEPRAGPGHADRGHDLAPPAANRCGDSPGTNVSLFEALCIPAFPNPGQLSR
jgi:hypothetical protein